MEPRCTGMCGAFAIRPPSASKIAQEKSRRSLMLTECAVDLSRSPICSAIAMNRLENTSSSTGSAPVPARAAGEAGATRVSSRSRPAVTAACHPGSTTVVARSSAMIAGPSTCWPGASAARRYSGTVAHSPAVNMGTCSSTGALGGAARATWGAGDVAGAEVTAASTEMASTTMGLSSMRKEKRAR